MPVTAETLLVRLEATQAKFEKQMKAADRAAQRSANRIEGRFKKMNRNISRQFRSVSLGFSKGLLGGAAAAVSVVGLKRLEDAVKSAVSELSEIGKVADKVGLTTDQLQSLRVQAELSGVGIKNLDTAMQRFSRRVGEAAAGGGVLKDILEEQDIAIRDNTGRMRPLFNILKDYADAIKRTSSEQERLNLTNKAFDTEGAGLVNLFKQGGAALDDFVKRARDIGLLFDEGLIRRAEEIEDKFTIASRVLRVQFLELLLELAPAILKVTEAFTALVRALKGAGGGDPFGNKSLARTNAALDDQFNKLRRLNQQYNAAARAIAAGELVDASINAALDAEFRKLDVLERRLLEMRRLVGDNPAAQAAAMQAIKQVEDAIKRTRDNIGRLAQDIDAERRQAAVQILQLQQDRDIAIAQGKVTKQFLEMEAIAKNVNNALRGAGTGGGGGRISDSAAREAASSGLLNLIMAAEGTTGNRRSRGFNTTLGFGQFTGGPIVLVNKTLREILDIQRKMLAAPGNNFTDGRPGIKGSSAIGAFQITRETLQSLIGQMNLSLDEMFTPELQTRLAQQLVDQTGGSLEKLRNTWQGLKNVSDEALISAIDNTTNLGTAQAQQLQRQREILAGAERGNQQLQMEAELIGKSTFEREKALATQQLLNELQAANIPITDELRAAVERLASAQANAAVTAEQAQINLQQSIENSQIALDRQIDAMDEIRSLAKDVLGGFIDDLRNGVSVSEALANALERIGDRLLDIALNSIIDSLFGPAGGVGGGLFGGLLGGFFKAGGVVKEMQKGGLITGPGTGTSDSIPAVGSKGRLYGISDGEFIVNARATRRHRDLLEAINSNQVPSGFAQGTASAMPEMRAMLNAKIVNAIDGPSFLAEALSGRSGERILLNHVRARPRAFRQAIGV